MRELVFPLELSGFFLNLGDFLSPLLFDRGGIIFISMGGGGIIFISMGDLSPVCLSVMVDLFRF